MALIEAWIELHFLEFVVFLFVLLISEAAAFAREKAPNNSKSSIGLHNF